MIYIKIYPFVVALIAFLLNFLLLGVQPHHISLPAKEVIYALEISAILLLINHAWLMTATELTRGKFKMFATPEEWLQSGKNQKDASPEGIQELERHHNIHRNTTENVVYYILLCAIFMMITPSGLATYTWVLLFPLARLGYTYSYIKGSDNWRGVFMSLGLLSLFGMASYMILSIAG